jgi:hypothetical protein
MDRGVFMTSEQIFETIRSSHAFEWHREELRNVEGHAFVATLKSNASIKIQWGRTCIRDFAEPWLKTIFKSEASVEDAEILHEGHKLWTERYLVIDNRRALLPLPKSTSRTIPRDQIHFASLLNALSSNDSTHFDACLKLNEIEATEEGWPLL